MAAVNFYGSFRSGSEIIYREYKDSATYERDIRGIAQGLKSQKRKLETWTEKWLFWEEMPKTVFQDLWGRKGYEEIGRGFKDMGAVAEDAKKELKNYLLTQEEWDKLNAATRLKRKRVFVMYKRKYVRDLITNMAEQMKEIDDCATSARNNRRIDRTTPFDPIEIQHRAMGHLLISLAMASYRMSDEVANSCRAVPAPPQTGLDLDVLSMSQAAHRGTYLRSLAKAVKAGCLDFTILTWDVNTPQMEPTRLSVRLEQAQGDQAVRLADVITNWLTLPGDIHLVQNQPDGPWYTVSTAPYDRGGTLGSRLSLRQRQARDNPPDKPINYELFGETNLAKFRVAYELAQACLLFLRTSWFTDICTCAVICIEYAREYDETYCEFSMSLGPSQHHPAKLGTSQKNQCWGKREQGWDCSPTTKAIRRLGILLVEVLLGGVVCKVDCDNNRIANFYFLVVSPVSGVLVSTRQPLSAVLSNVQSVTRAASQQEAFQKAVKFCVDASLPSPAGPAHDEDVVKSLLIKFYRTVLVPIKRAYDAELNRYLQDEQDLRSTLSWDETPASPS